MRDDSGLGILRLALWVWWVDVLVFGALTLVLPGLVVETIAGAEGFDYFWVRWAGGVLLGLAAGGWFVIRRPEGQGAFVTTIVFVPLLAGLGLLLGWALREYEGAAWFLLLVLVATLGVGVLNMWARTRAAAILYPPRPDETSPADVTEG